MSFAGNATYPKASELRDAAAAVPADRILVETDSPYLSPQPVRGQPNEPANVVTHGRGRSPKRAARSPHELAARTHANAARRVRAGVTVEPKKSLGQHFLVDENILGVIDRMSDLRATDVVLEVGPGLGVLTRYLADRVTLVHAIELDRSLEPVLRDALAGHANVRLLWDDALRVDVGELRPPPTKLSPTCRTTSRRRSSWRLSNTRPRSSCWCVMVQREVADRFFAAPRTKAYGAVSVLVQLSARKTDFHRVPPTVFRPTAAGGVRARRLRARADGADRRRPTRRRGGVRASAEDGGERARTGGLATRSQVEEALASLGRLPTVRAEELTPSEFVALAGALR